jgi:penicillin-binding protein 2
VAVVAEHSGFGATSAAPVARQMIDQYLLGKVIYQTPQAVVPAGPAEQVPAEDDSDNTEGDDNMPAPPPDSSSPVPQN